VQAALDAISGNPQCRCAMLVYRGRKDPFGDPYQINYTADPLGGANAESHPSFGIRINNQGCTRPQCAVESTLAHEIVHVSFNAPASEDSPIREGGPHDLGAWCGCTGTGPGGSGPINPTNRAVQKCLQCGDDM
jgi:hypothetical protein